MIKIREENKGVKVGARFGMWTVIGPSFRAAGWRAVSRCDCGAIAAPAVAHLASGASTGCGCTRFSSMRESLVTHGESHTKLYRVWKGIRERCINPKHKSWHNYGGRGISVCQSWMDHYKPFRDWAIANGWQEGMQVDRVDNDGNYEPKNCRITTNMENSNNQRRTRKYLAFGELKTIRHWSRDPRCRVSHDLLRARIKQGFQPERAITEPCAPKDSRLFFAFGEEKTLTEWSKDERCVVKDNTLRRRIEYGWSAEKSLTTPVRGK